LWASDAVEEVPPGFGLHPKLLQPGLLSVALGFVEGTVAFADPAFVRPTGDLIDFHERLRFVVVGVCVSVICEALHRQRRRAEAQTELMRVTLADTTEEPVRGSIHSDDLEALRTAWAAARRSGTRYESEFRCRRQNGVYRWLMARALPLRDGERRVTKWIATLVDTDELRQAQDALREADHRKDEFLAILAHELRNPLAPIRTSRELLKRAGGDDAVRRL
jgi:signal transduction histidine kinase